LWFSGMFLSFLGTLVTAILTTVFSMVEAC
jgi:hypothetical protein